jgi:hypothetical protein
METQTFEWNICEILWPSVPNHVDESCLVSSNRGILHTCAPNQGCLLARRIRYRLKLRRSTVHVGFRRITIQKQNACQ